MLHKISQMILSPLSISSVPSHASALLNRVCHTTSRLLHETNCCFIELAIHWETIEFLKPSDSGGYIVVTAS